MLNVILRWLVREGYGGVLSFSDRYHEDNGLSEEGIRRWWLEQLPLLRPQHPRKFGVSEAHGARQKKKVGKLPYGTATLPVCRAELLHKV